VDAFTSKVFLGGIMEKGFMMGLVQFSRGSLDRSNSIRRASTSKLRTSGKFVVESFAYITKNVLFKGAKASYTNLLACETS
jgi:hypothetical protein